MQGTAFMRGFTFYEALISLTILSILVAIGVPAFGNLADRAELRGEHDLLLTALQRARSLAVETASRIVVCPRSGADECSDKPHWHEGWLVFRDDDGDRERDRDETIFEASPPLDSGTRMTSSRYRRRVGFQATGTSFGSNVTIRICPEKPGLDPLALIVSNSGRARTQKIPRAACSGN